MPGSHTGLSPEWARRPEEAFAELVSHDDDLVRAEFERLTRSTWPGADRTPPQAVPHSCVAADSAAWQPDRTRP